MSIHVALHHETRYTYDRPVALGPQVVRLRPAAHCRTPVLSYALTVQPAEHFLNWQQDPQGNHLARIVVPRLTQEFVVEVDLTCDLTVINPFDFFIETSAELFPFEYEPALAHELKPFLARDEKGPRLTARLAQVDARPRRTIDFLVDVNRTLQQEIRYLIRLEPGIQSCEETLERGSGSCRDSAWLLVQILRHWGIAARFVSGYLIQLKPDVKPLDGPAGAEADFTDLHAWAEAYLPGAGWIGLDPTSGLLAGEGHLPLACAPHPVSAAPISGAVSESESTLQFSMSVTRIREDPRVTFPFDDAQWEAVQTLGREVDRRLMQGDVRLTMGGEPTFVSIDDMDGPQWNTEALGREKRIVAGDLIRRLRRRFAPGGVLHYGQGKWYPGESLPRWALTLLWRADGEPLWENAELIADDAGAKACGYDEAEAFTHALARRLDVQSDYVCPVFEDLAHYLLAERKLPLNVDPRDPRLNDPEVRDRMMRVFERGLDRPVGCVLPLRRQWWQARARPNGPGPRWISGPWPVRRERMYLLPGDSPIGLRLPLDSLPWAPPEQAGELFEIDPFEPRAPLPPLESIRQQRLPRGGSDLPPPTGGGGAELRGGAAAGAGPDGIVRTALCVEPRDGRLHVFLPPVERLEDFVDLLAAIEATAAGLGLPVVLEGYLPPRDPRLRELKVTPDPGVIEVNVQPAVSWEELVEITTGLYSDARDARLGTEKFMLDGKHAGTGGGNHLVLGGPTPGDSPFLRRPDLLRSLVVYWNNHPSLSYLFSGQFVGPTSQAPRVDEGRRDALDELELACRQIQPHAAVPPWHVDRVFRDLLVDLTGNTHRAEFCIDKLYSPDSASGRLGLVEFRGFEMPPHPRMSLVQQLLLRALVVRFWEQPETRPLVHWGEMLHDRFLLPYFVKRDFDEVLEELRAAGIPLDPAWFGAQFEFRFSRIGTVQYGGVELELTNAIEPWYVLGEEPGTGGTTRFVDSSVERLQVRVRNLVPGRHAVTVNQRRIPLFPTDTPGEYVAGVRYRAWQPPRCLHPTIPVDTPLVFDIYDEWNGRSLGGCGYHAMHPGGRNYTTFPVNAYEAEARRRARFFPTTQGSGAFAMREVAPARGTPVTLDLRRG